MIIPSVYLKGGTLVDPKDGEKIEDVTGCLDTISLCQEFTIVYLDKVQETKEFGKKVMHRTSCCVEIELNSEDEVLDILDSGANSVILNKDHQLHSLGEFLPRERIVCKLPDQECSVAELAEEINDLKHRSSTFLLCPKKASLADESCLVESIKELKTHLCDDVKLILSIDGVILSSTISQLHFLGVQVQLSTTWLLNDLSLGEIIASCLKSDRSDGLYPTLVVSLLCI